MGKMPADGGYLLFLGFLKKNTSPEVEGEIMISCDSMESRCGQVHPRTQGPDLLSSPHLCTGVPRWLYFRGPHLAQF